MYYSIARWGARLHISKKGQGFAYRCPQPVYRVTSLQTVAGISVSGTPWVGSCGLCLRKMKEIKMRIGPSRRRHSTESLASRNIMLFLLGQQGVSMKIIARKARAR